MTDMPVAPTDENTADAVVQFSQQAERLRALGCRCLLAWNDRLQRAVPLSRTPESERCPARHYPEE